MRLSKKSAPIIAVFLCIVIFCFQNCSNIHLSQIRKVVTVMPQAEKCNESSASDITYQGIALTRQCSGKAYELDTSTLGAVGAAAQFGSGMSGPPPFNYNPSQWSDKAQYADGLLGPAGAYFRTYTGNFGFFEDMSGGNNWPGVLQEIGPDFVIGKGKFISLAFTPQAHGRLMIQSAAGSNYEAPFVADPSYPLTDPKNANLGIRGRISVSTTPGQFDPSKTLVSLSTKDFPGKAMRFTLSTEAADTDVVHVSLGTTYYLNFAAAVDDSTSLCFTANPNTCDQTRLAYTFTTSIPTPGDNIMNNNCDDSVLSDASVNGVKLKRQCQGYFTYPFIVQESGTSLHYCDPSVTTYTPNCILRPASTIGDPQYLWQEPWQYFGPLLDLKLVLSRGLSGMLSETWGDYVSKNTGHTYVPIIYDGYYVSFAMKIDSPGNMFLVYNATYGIDGLKSISTQPGLFDPKNPQVAIVSDGELAISTGPASDFYAHIDTGKIYYLNITAHMPTYGANYSSTDYTHLQPVTCTSGDWILAAQGGVISHVYPQIPAGVTYSGCGPAYMGY